MGLQTVSFLIDRYKSITIPDKELREGVVGCVRDIAGCDVDISTVSIRNGVITIKVNSLVKSELYMRSEKIIACVVRGDTKCNIKGVL